MHGRTGITNSIWGPMYESNNSIHIFEGELTALWAAHKRPGFCQVPLVSNSSMIISNVDLQVAQNMPAKNLSLCPEFSMYVSRAVSTTLIMIFSVVLDVMSYEYVNKYCHR